MSWDAGIFHRNAQINQHEASPPIGTLAEVRAIIDRVFPEAEWEANHIVMLPGVFLRLSCTSRRKSDAMKPLNPFLNKGSDALSHEELTQLAMDVHNMEVDDDEEIMHISIEGRGGGDFVTPLIKLCRAGGWSLCDYQDGEFVDLDNPTPARETATNFQQAVREFKRKQGWDN